MQKITNNILFSQFICIIYYAAKTTVQKTKQILRIESSIIGPLNFTQETDGEDSKWVISLNGQSHENEDRITAYYTKDDGTKVAVGHLNMVSYSKQNMKVVVVPVNENYTPSAQEIKAYLDNTYKSAITFWDVSIADPLEVDFEDNQTQGLDTELPDVAAFTKEMRNIKRAMKSRNDYNKNNYYIFLIKKSEKGNKNGIMPFRRHFGFVFMEDSQQPSQQLKANSQKLQHTVAHELAHGAFGLEHPWQSKGTTQGGTYNLLDYTAKTPNNLLRKYQWYVIHNPRLSLFGGDEEEVSDGEGLFENPVCVKKFLEKFRYAYLFKQKIEYPKDNYWSSGQYASEITLLDGNKYKKISISIHQDLGFVPREGEQESYINNTTSYNYGKILTIHTNKDNKDNFHKYIFPDNKNTWNNQIDDLINSIHNSSAKDKILDLLTTLPAREYKKLKTDKRYEYLKLIAQGWLTEDYVDCVNDEQIAVNLLSNFSNVQSQKNMTGYLKNDAALIKKLYSGIGEKENDRFVENLTILVTNSLNKSDLSVSSNKHYIWNPNEVTIKGRFNGNKLEIWSLLPPKSLISNIPVEINNNYLHPLEIVGICFNDNTICYLPAIKLYKLYDNKEYKDTEKGIDMLLNIAAMSTAVNILIKGGSTLAKAISIAELSTFTLNTLIESPVISAELLSSKEGTEFLETWRKIRLVVDLSTLGVGALESFVKNYSKVQKTLNKLPDDEIKKLEEIFKGSRYQLKVYLRNSLAEVLKIDANMIDFGKLDYEISKVISKELSNAFSKYKVKPTKIMPDLEWKDTDAGILAIDWENGERVFYFNQEKLLSKAYDNDINKINSFITDDYEKVDGFRHWHSENIEDLITHEIGHLRTKNNSYQNGLDIKVDGETISLDFETLNEPLEVLEKYDIETANKIKVYLKSYDIDEFKVSGYGNSSILEAVAELSLMQSKGVSLTQKQLEFLNIHLIK